MTFGNISYVLSGTFTSGVETNIGPSGTTYELLDYGSPKPSQQWVGSASTIISNVNGVEEGIKALFKFDEADSGQLDIYAYPFTRFNGKIWREENYLAGELHQPIARISGISTIFDITVEGITQSGAAIIRIPQTETT